MVLLLAYLAGANFHQILTNQLIAAGQAMRNVRLNLCFDRVQFARNHWHNVTLHFGHQNGRLSIGYLLAHNLSHRMNDAVAELPVLGITKSREKKSSSKRNFLLRRPFETNRAAKN